MNLLVFVELRRESSFVCPLNLRKNLQKEKIEQRFAAASETHIRRSDANEAFQGHSERWKADEQRQNAEYGMKSAEFNSEAHIYSRQSAGANMTAHEFKQVLIQ